MTTNSRTMAAAKTAAAWAAAQRLQQFGFGEICRDVSLSMRFVYQIVNEWERDGKVRMIGETPRQPSKRKIFEVIPHEELRVVTVLGDGFEQMWTAMRKMSAFSAVDLSAHCAAEVPLDEARAYCRLLLAGGYLRVVQKAVPNRREAIYRLANVTGVQAPRERRVRCIVDPNLGKTTPLAEAGQ